MTKPRPEIQAFLAETRWSSGQIKPVAGDASLRRYWRVHMPGEATTVLMDAPPETGETTKPFLDVGAHLQRLGYSAPRILKSDPTSGLILMEDLGDDLFARVVKQAPDIEPALYEAAVDMLADLASHNCPETFPIYDAEQMAEKASLAGTWYANSDVCAMGIQDAMASALAKINDMPSALALRDFHAENLLWLPDRSGHARVGLLDFQDAMRAPVGYDLISLLYDARRDVSPALAAQMKDRFATATGLPRSDLERSFAVLGAQRSLRIIGVFARLSLHFGKASYVDLLPRVWGQLSQFLDDPSLSDLAKTVHTYLRVPNEGHLSDLRARCGTIPNL